MLTVRAASKKSANKFSTLQTEILLSVKRGKIMPR